MGVLGKALIFTFFSVPLLLGNPQISSAEDSESKVAKPKAEATATPAASGDVLFKGLSFKKDGKEKAVISLDGPVAFDLNRTAPSEYVLTLPGVKNVAGEAAPQLAPTEFSALRAARLVPKDDSLMIRMFVTPSVGLIARLDGANVVLEATDLGSGVGARAQLAPDAPAAPAAPAPAAASASDETARRNPTGIVSSDGSKVYTGRLISLDLQDTDIDNALRIIAEVSNLNIIASEDVGGKVTLRLIDVPWDQALDVILKTNGLDQVTEGNVIRIAPVDKLRQEREALREAKRAAENLEDLKVNYIRVSYARVSEMREQVETVLSERGSVSIDERTNQLIIKDILDGQNAATELIKRLDLRTPQVLLETQIVEGQRKILRDLGFQWNFSYIQSPETGNATGYNFPNTVNLGGGLAGDSGTQAVDFPAANVTSGEGSAISMLLDSADGSKLLAARLTALEQEGKVKVVSRPQVATVNNKEAEIKSVETVRVRLPDSGTSVATGAGASSSGGSSAFEEIEVGIEMRVTPQASPDHYVLLDINAKSSTFGNNPVDNIPSTLERTATSTILVKSGQTFALGGVYRVNDSDQLSGVPFLKDIPVLGHLFRRSLVEKSDEELIFFITPHIVEGSFDSGVM